MARFNHKRHEASIAQNTVLLHCLGKLLVGWIHYIGYSLQYHKLYRRKYKSMNLDYHITYLATNMR